MILFFLSSGLFLGWSLGANDAANVFGTAVGSRMLSFKKAVAILSVFVILGAVFQGDGATQTLGKLGSIDAIAGAFTVALAAASTIFIMSRYKLPSSTSQAVVGAILGWNFFTHTPTNPEPLIEIISTWILCPILGAIFAIVIYSLLKLIIHKSKIHLLNLDAHLRVGLIIVGAFGSFSLGANNIANIMGVFVTVAAPKENIDLFLFQLSGVQQLFLLGGISIAVGAITYSKRVMKTLGNNILELSSEAAFVVVLSHSLVLFIFSSKELSNLFVSIGLPKIPLVPVSSTQAIVGAILGVGILKKAREINFSVLGQIATGWVTTPIIAGGISFFALFFVNNVFEQPVKNRNTTTVVQNSYSPEPVSSNELTLENLNPTNSNQIEHYQVNKTLLILSLITSSLIVIIGVRKFKQLKRKNSKLNRALLNKIKNIEQAYLEKENEINILVKELQDKEFYYNVEMLRKDADYILLKSYELINLNEKISSLINPNSSSKTSNEIIEELRTHQTLEKEKEKFVTKAKEVYQDFLNKLDNHFPKLSNREITLLVMVKLNLSSKEIGIIENINTRSVEMQRYRLRQKLRMTKTENLQDLVNRIKT